MSEVAATAYEADGVKKYYGGTITVAGRNLITSLLAGETIEFTRVMVGSGAMLEGVEPIDMTDLVNPIAEASSTIPIVEDGEMFMVVEYRNDMNGGLKTGFWLSEFGIYAKTEKTEEVLLYYATLGDSPQPVNPYKDNRIDIRRYPVTIALELDADVQVTYNPGAFVTSAEARQLVDAMAREAMDKRLAVYHTDLTIPAEGWSRDGTGNYPFRLDIPVEGASERMIPALTVLEEGESAAIACGLAPRVQSLDGAVRVFAASVPAEPIPASLTLQGDASGLILSGGGESPVLTPGAGLIRDEHGNLAVDFAPGDEVQNIFKGSNG